MATELEVLRIVSDRLTTVGIPYHADGLVRARLLHDPPDDIVVALAEQDV